MQRNLVVSREQRAFHYLTNIELLPCWLTIHVSLSYCRPMAKLQHRYIELRQRNSWHSARSYRLSIALDVAALFDSCTYRCSCCFEHVRPRYDFEEIEILVTMLYDSFFKKMFLSIDTMLKFIRKFLPYYTRYMHEINTIELINIQVMTAN